MSYTFDRKRWNKPVKQPRTHQPERFKWTDPYDQKEYMAGGILLFDAVGFWCVREAKGLSDMGGRYHFEDNNIFGCIAKELREESFGTLEVLASQIESIVMKTRMSVSDIHPGSSRVVDLPHYFCLFCNICEYDLGLKFDPELFLVKRQETISQNKSVDPVHYTSLELVYVKFADIDTTTWTANGHLIGDRLKRLLLVSKIVPQTSS